MAKASALSYSLIGLSAIAYVLLAYAIPREAFAELLLVYTLVFACYVYIINRRINVWHGLAAAVLFRLLFLFAVPALSHDYLRFIWDGRLLLAGFNPYLYLPAFFVDPAAPVISGITPELLQQLNSPNTYSIHPPVAQGIFWLTEKLAGGSIMGSVVVMRLILLLAEVGNMWLLLRLLRKMALSDKHVLLYALNPLVILELTGNLHLEALMIFFILLALYQLCYHRHLVAGMAFGAAVATKLLPLMFLPFVVRKLGLQRFLYFFATFLLTLLVLFYPLVSAEVLHNSLQSIYLYFRNSEFNASVYYLLRWLGFRLTGYNQIAVLAPLLSLITLIAILWLASVKKLGSVRRLAGYMAAALTICLLLATTVSPWYITTLVALTALSHFRYAVVWSWLAILPYAAYSTSNYTEDLLLVTLEYSLLAIWLVAELYLYRQHKRQHNLKD